MISGDDYKFFWLEIKNMQNKYKLNKLQGVRKREREREKAHSWSFEQNFLQTRVSKRGTLEENLNEW
jgi:hypothetical protein